MLLLRLRSGSLALELLLALRLLLSLLLLALLGLHLLLAWQSSPWAPGAFLAITTVLRRRTSIVAYVVSAGVNLLAVAGTRILVLEAGPVSPGLLALLALLALLLLTLTLLALLLSPCGGGLLLALTLALLALLLSLLSGSTRTSDASLAQRLLTSGSSLLFSGGRFSAGFRNFDVNFTAVDVLVVQEGDRFLSLLDAAEFDEAITEGTGAAGNDVSTDYATGNAEFFAKFLGADFEGQVTNENFGGHFLR